MKKPFVILLSLIVISLSSLFGQQAPVSFEAQPELVALKEKWQDAKERALNPINRVYIEELRKLKVKYAQRGETAMVKAIDSEINKLQKPAQKLSSFRGALDITVEADQLTFSSKDGKTSAVVILNRPFPNAPLAGSIKRNYDTMGGERKFGKPLQGEEVIFSKRYIVHICSKSLLFWDFQEKAFDSVLVQID